MKRSTIFTLLLGVFLLFGGSLDTVSNPQVNSSDEIIYVGDFDVQAADVVLQYSNLKAESFEQKLVRRFDENRKAFNVLYSSTMQELQSEVIYVKKKTYQYFRHRFYTKQAIKVNYAIISNNRKTLHAGKQLLIRQNSLPLLFRLDNKLSHFV